MEKTNSYNHWKCRFHSVKLPNFIKEQDLIPMSDYPAQLKQLLIYLEDIHAIDIKIIDVRKQTSITDYMIITSGRSSRHVKSIAEFIMEHMKAAGTAAHSSHGLESGEWVLVDFVDFVVHVMQPDSRSFYNLEGLWQSDQAL